MKNATRAANSSVDMKSVNTEPAGGQIQNLPTRSAAAAGLQSLAATLGTGRRLVESITDDQYLLSLASASTNEHSSNASEATCQAQKRASVGCHFRHLLDLCRTVAHAAELGASFHGQFNDKVSPTAAIVVNYDIRRRHTNLETSRGECLDEFRDLESLAVSLSSVQYNAVIPVSVVSELECSNTNESLAVASTLARELCFASLHATHHFAIITQILNSHGLAVNPQASLAPATKRALEKDAG